MAARSWVRAIFALAYSKPPFVRGISRTVAGGVLSFLQRMDFKYHIGLDVCRVLVLAYKGCHRIRKRIDKNIARSEAIAETQKRKEKANAKSN